MSDDGQVKVVTIDGTPMLVRESSGYDLSVIPTCDLVRELEKREGIDRTSVGVGEYINLSCGEVQHFEKIIGPAKILVVVD